MHDFRSVQPKAWQQSSLFQLKIIDNLFLTGKKMKRCLVTVLYLMVSHNILVAKELTLDDAFPADRVLDVQITIDEKDWDTIRYQSRNFFEALQESRKYGPTDSPYTYVEASVSIDGVEFPQVGIRKKGFLGSLNSNRPSLKIKLNHVDKKGQIGGATNLSFNNNQQDISLISQFMGYALFNAAGSPAPRCAYAKLTVNGTSLGIYSHVERIHRPLLKRAFDNDNGTLYEGQVVGFFPGWEGSFEHKLGKDKLGRKKIKELIEVLEGEDENIEQAIGRLVDLDSFYTFWAMEGLLSFWDGYSGNKNNFFIYLNLETDKFHFIPWGADCMFERYSPIRNDRYDPLSVKKQGLIAHRLYQLESGRQRYRQTLRNIMEQHWDEEALLMETKRIEALVKPHLAISDKTEADFDQDEARGWIEWAKNASPEEREGAINSEKFRSLSLKVQEAIMEGIEKLKKVGEKGELSEEAGKDESDKYDDEDEEKGQEEQLAYRFVRSLEERRRFIRQRRGEIMAEIANGMPKWETKPADPFVFKLIFGIPIPIANWGELVNVFRLILFGSILVLIAIFLCCFQLFGRRYSIHWYLQVLKKYIVFSGRARRNEFWMFQIFNTLAFIIFPIISTIFPIIIGWDLDLILIVYGLSMGLYGLGTLIPSLAVSIRRLHDTGRSGWRLLVGLMPLVGWILTLIWYLSDSEARENKYGPNPKISG